MWCLPTPSFGVELFNSEPLCFRSMKSKLASFFILQELAVKILTDYQVALNFGVSEVIKLWTFI